MRSLAALLVCLCAISYGQDVRTGYYRGRTIHYEIKDGLAITEGDIVLGTAAELANTQPESSKTLSKEAIGISDLSYRWANGVIPYTISTSLPNKQRVTDAVAHWNTNTPIQLVPRTNETDYITFVRNASGGCFTYVGDLGIGSQKINLGDSCSTGSTIHEIGHAVGLYHEQSRQDRNYYLQVHYENLDKREFGQYDQQLTNAVDSGGYDYASIMHYGDQGFSRNDLPTLASIPPGIPFGQRTGLSTGDIDAVKRIYGAPSGGVTVSTYPAGLTVLVDGQRYTAPAVFQWSDGSAHTLDVPDQTPGSNYRYTFGRWSDDGAQSHSITVSGNTTVYTANFIQMIRASSASFPPTGGTVRVDPPSADGYYPSGTLVSFTPVPNAGFNFVGWTGRGFFQYTGKSAVPSAVVLDDPSLEYDANFDTGAVTRIVSTPPGQVAKVDGKSVTLPANFAWPAGTTHTISVSTTPQTNFAQTTRYGFQNWSDGGAATHDVTATVDGATITAAFSTQYLVSTSASAGGFVQVIPQSVDNFYDAGTQLTVNPVASGSSQFSNWYYDLAGNQLGQTVTVNDQVLIGAQFLVPKQVSTDAITNGASFVPSRVAPGEIITIFGIGFGPQNLVGLQVNPQTHLVSTSLSGIRVLFDGKPAPLLYVLDSQISAVVPYSVAGQPSTLLQVEVNGQANRGAQVSVASAVPALFTADSSGGGLAVAVNQDGSVNSSSMPALRGSVVVLYATGEGQTVPAGVDGKPAAAPLPKPILPVHVTIGGHDAPVIYAGGAPSFLAGVMQINVIIPPDAPIGEVPVSLAVGGTGSLAITTLAVR